ncbi:hypothetical protein RHECNPAF_770092 [Rhizobium etli CNPAF512]|nr:hypothetical protein RHECNPAF_770092 [Rhizobium etli CNPAF512]
MRLRKQSFKEGALRRSPSPQFQALSIGLYSIGSECT